MYQILDEDKAEEIFNNEVRQLQDYLSSIKSIIHTIDFQKCLEVNDIYNIIKEVMVGCNVNITYDDGVVGEKDACISIRGTEIVFPDPSFISSIMDYAHSVSFSSKKSGVIQVDFMFYNLTNIINIERRHD